LHALAPGLTPRSVLEKFAAVQMINVHLPTTDGRELLLTRYTEPEPELRLLSRAAHPVVVPTLGGSRNDLRYLGTQKCSNRRS
jgi:hypothetical protein